MADQSVVHTTLARLRAASRTLAQATNIEAVVDALVTSVLSATGANAAAVVIPHRDGSLELVGSTFPADTTVHSMNWRVDSPLPVNDAMRSGQAVWLHNREDLVTRYPEAPGWE